MASALGRTHADFARYFNLKKRSCGHVWQARFFSCPLETTHLWRAMAYVERNPVRAGMVDEAERYQWSSASIRLGLTEMPGFLDLAPWQAEYTRVRWKKMLDDGLEEEAFGERLRQANRTGRPLGGDEFIRGLEGSTGRQLKARPAGRPKRSGEKENAQLSLGIGV